MAIDRTAANLATFCLSVVGAPYWFACYGNVASEALYNSKRSEPQNKKYYDSWSKSTFTDDYGKRVTDCAGLLKWFLWAKSMDDKSPTYKASEDFGATSFYNKCTSKGKISSLPENKIGICVFNGNDTTKTHMGVIVDQIGTVVDARGHAYGVVKNSKASSWDYWGKCHLIKYDAAPPVKDQYTVVTQYQPLTVRKDPTSKSEEIDKLAKGSKFISTNIVEGENINGCTAWAGVNGGYVSGYYLSPTPKVPDPEPDPEPVPPDPEPTPAPSGHSYTVKVNTYLSLRTGPGTGYDEVGRLFNGAIVTAVEESGNWIKISGDLWCSKAYLK